MITNEEWATKLTIAIAQYGQQLIGVFGTSEEPAPNFTYTIGLHPKFGFELIAVGLPHHSAAVILNSIGAELRADAKIELDVPDDRWANLPLMFKETSSNKVRDYVCQADHFYETKVRVLQLVLPDKYGKFPAEAGYDSEYMNKRQIILY